MEETEAQTPSQSEKADARKPYIKPEIIFDLKLETRAGSPLRLPDPLDPLERQQ